MRSTAQARHHSVPEAEPGLKVAITIDMEHDCPPFLTTYRGIEEGAPRILRLLAEEGVRATFFTTGDVGRRYPDTMRRLVDEGHELGCHGDTHRRFSTLDHEGARREIHDASEVLRTFYPVTSFRAPNLDFPAPYLEILREEGYRLDSSQGRHKLGSYFVQPTLDPAFSRIPASMSPSVMRLPMAIRRRVLALLDSPVVLFVHPWEFVDQTHSALRIDNRFKTGEPAVTCLRETITHFKSKQARFHRLADLAPQ